jgi:hypothetical protein
MEEGETAEEETVVGEEMEAAVEIVVAEEVVEVILRLLQQKRVWPGSSMTTC